MSAISENGAYEGRRFQYPRSLTVRSPVRAREKGGSVGNRGPALAGIGMRTFILAHRFRSVHQGPCCGTFKQVTLGVEAIFIVSFLQYFRTLNTLQLFMVDVPDNCCGRRFNL